MALMLMLALVMAAPLLAQQSPLSSPLNNKEQIEITADGLDVDNRNRTFVFKGNVKVVQGQTVITSQLLKVWYNDSNEEASSTPDDNSRIRNIEASGNVVILFDGRTAKADKAVYSTAQETLTLIGGNPTVVDGKNSIRGTKITLYRAKDRITVEGSSKGRVEAVFFPGGEDSN